MQKKNKNTTEIFHIIGNGSTYKKLEKTSLNNNVVEKKLSFTILSDVGDYLGEGRRGGSIPHTEGKLMFSPYQSLPPRKVTA